MLVVLVVLGAEMALCLVYNCGWNMHDCDQVKEKETKKL